jgi:hypothetical protein
MFHGLSVVQCELSEKEILSLMQDADGLRTRLAIAINDVMSPVVKRQRATWAMCKPSAYGHPTSLQSAIRSKDGSIVFVQDESSKNINPIIDSAEWQPELSPDGFVGFFHHWHKSTRDNRLCLYVVCQSYLPKACLEFAELVHQVGDACTAGSICLSEETQWLRTACSRNRARLIAEVCGKMGIRVPLLYDYNSYDPHHAPMAMVTTETLHYDLVPCGFSKVKMLNYCAETQRAFNGVVCAMAPWDGVWIFQGVRDSARGAQHHHCGISDFGYPYGQKQLLPTAAPKVKDRERYLQCTSLTFTSADPLQCRPLQVWSAPESLVVSCEHKSPAVSTVMSIPREEELDPDIVRALKYSLALQACPQQYVIPNLPGVLPSAQASNFLVFDEYVLEVMARQGWARTLGIVMLTPLAVGLFEHWKSSAMD